MRPVTIIVALILLSITHATLAERVVYTAKLIRTMAPLSPLTLMWTAVSRENISGDTARQEELMSRYGALKAITIDAAWILGVEDSIGSIRVGKAADFTVLSADPMTVALETLRSIDVISTLLAGTTHRSQ